MSNRDKIHSAYDTLKRERIWIITEAHRSAITILLARRLLKP
jgi:hypothetical protein